MQRPQSRTLAALIDELAQRHPDRPALSCSDRTWSFAQFRILALDVAKALYADGVRKGDKVAILMGNRVEWLAANFAIQYLGATMVALNTWYTPRELAYVLDHSEVSLLITADRFLKTDYVSVLGDVLKMEKLPRLRRVVVLGEAPVPNDWVGYETYVAKGAAVCSGEIAQARDAVDAEDTAYILYTSGSTARPKGVMLRHDGLLTNGFNIGERLHFDQNDVVFIPVSLFWGLGCENALMAAWTHGAHIVLQGRFDAGEALELIERYRCTAVHGTANITYMLFDHPRAESTDLSQLRKGVAGGTPEAIRDVITRYMPLACHAYGLTETYGYATVTDASDPIDWHAETFGRPLPGFSFKIVSPETGEALSPGEVGEIRLKGWVMAGYYKSPELTAEAFDGEGFLKTGDLGYLNQDGGVVFKGRLKEMLKTGGMNVSPAEVEDVLRLHPGVADAYVTALPDPVRDQVIAAIILPQVGAQNTEDEILAHCRAQLAAFKTPRHIRFVRYEDLPFTTTGKIHRLRLPELFDPVP